MGFTDTHVLNIDREATSLQDRLFGITQEAIDSGDESRAHELFAFATELLIARNRLDYRTMGRMLDRWEREVQHGL